MTDDTPTTTSPVDARAAELAAMAQATTAATLPIPAVDLTPGDPAAQAAITARMGEINIADTQTILKFGASAQNKLTTLSDEMLEGVRNKDVGPAGDALRSMVTTIRGFDTDELDPNRPQSWWEKLFSSTKPVAEFIAKYETVRAQIDSITDTLLGHETVLLKDVKFLDKLYASSLEFYHELALYIAAGTAKLAEIDTKVIPAKEAEVAAAPESDAVLKAQELRDIRAARDELERRIYDMKLTRQVTMQALPSIRLVQENDKSLINKINSTLVNTVPLWRTQLAQAVTVFRSREAAKVVREANDLTNELLTKNAETLRQANAEIRTEVERGVFDIENVKAANDTLIATIEDSLRIADEGKSKRAAAEQELQSMEAALKASLSAARAHPGAKTV